MSKQSGTSDADTTIQALRELAANFRDERGWNAHHTPKNLAMSIAIEAAEIMEHFQWDDFSGADKKEVANELADVLTFCLHLANEMDIDIATAFRDKMAHNARKYPVELFNKNRVGTEDYHRIKKSYRKGKAT